MRTKSRQLRAHLYTFSQPNGGDVFGITGDFEGGDVIAVSTFSTNIGAGGYVGTQFKVDGVAQGNGPSFWQSGGNVAAVLTEVLRVPPGRHRISLLANTGTAFPAGANNATMSLAELPG